MLSTNFMQICKFEIRSPRWGHRQSRNFPRSNHLHHRNINKSAKVDCQTHACSTPLFCFSPPPLFKASPIHSPLLQLFIITPTYPIRTIHSSCTRNPFRWKPYDALITTISSHKFSYLAGRIKPLFSFHSHTHTNTPGRSPLGYRWEHVESDEHYCAYKRIIYNGKFMYRLVF